MQAKDDFLQDLLSPGSITTIVDIGANPIDGDPPYKKMLARGLCQIIGFEPQKEALQELLVSKGPRETYLPYAVGDGQQHTLYRCAASGMTSLHKPHPDYLSIFKGFDALGEVIATESIQTKRLDEIDKISDMDMLKIDVQGSELAVFQSGREKLSHAVVIQTEVSFMPLYEKQPLFWEIDRELRQQGFVPHAFAAVKRWPIAPFSHSGNKRQPVNQLLEADVVYVRDFVDNASMTDEQIKQMALILHHCYESRDLVSHCLAILRRREAIEDSALTEYQRQAFQERHASGEFSIDSLPVSFYLR